MMHRVLVACEFSGIVRDAFRQRGFDAWSCDLEPTEQVGHHIQADVLSVLNQDWDLMIAHPPCTYLSRAGAHLWQQRGDCQLAALDFVLNLADAPIPHIAIENPIGRLNALWRYPDQVIQPWAFGDAFTKTTCLWLKQLPPLIASFIVQPAAHYRDGSGKWRQPFIDKVGGWDKEKRKRARSRTFAGIAQAMAQQWGAFLRGEDWI